jgi:putative ABC transport system ATP-binding protein
MMRAEKPNANAMPQLTDAAARLRGVTYSYRDARAVRRVLRGVDLTVARGECLAVLGRSGSGKSTLLNLLAGIDQAEHGEVEVAGTPIHRLQEPGLTCFRRRHIGLVYQSFNLIGTLTVAENVRLPLELNGVASGAAEDRAMHLLAACGLAERARDFPDQLSGGEQQRVALARALAHEPPLLLADEPTGNLDAVTGGQVLNLLHDLREQRGSALLLVTHSRQVAARADRVLVLQDGQLAAAASDLAW